MIFSEKVLLKGTATHEPSALVVPINSGIVAHSSDPSKTLTRNCRGTLLRASVESVVGKSSITRATAYQPLSPVDGNFIVHSR